MAIVCIQLTEIATDIGLGYPKESKSFQADSGCLLDDVHVGSGSIAVNGQIAVPRKKGCWRGNFSAGCWTGVANSQLGPVLASVHARLDGLGQQLPYTKSL